MQYKGQLEGFPQEIVEKMLNYQVQQGNKRDITVFEDTILRDVHNGGFKWDNVIILNEEALKNLPVNE